MASCSRKSISVTHETGIAQLIRKPPNQQQKAASKTTSIIIPIPKEVLQTMAAKKPPAMTAEEAFKKLDKMLGIRHSPAITQAPIAQPVQQQAPSRPTTPHGYPMKGPQYDPVQLSFAEAAKRLKKETGLSIFGGK